MLTIISVCPADRLPTRYQQVANRSPTVGRVSPVCRPTVGWLLANCRPTVGWQLVISKKLHDVKLPHDFKRKFRPIEEFNRWKASQREVLFLHTGLPILKTLLSTDHFFHHCLLVTGIRILCEDVITSNDIDIAHAMLLHYTRLLPVLYGETESTYNSHCLTHCAEQVRAHGPLILHSKFVFESMLAHGTFVSWHTGHLWSDIQETWIYSALQSAYSETCWRKSWCQRICRQTHAIQVFQRRGTGWWYPVSISLATTNSNSKLSYWRFLWRQKATDDC